MLYAVHMVSLEFTSVSLLILSYVVHAVKQINFKVSKSHIAVCNRNHHTATGNHMRITQCYLPPGRVTFPPLLQAEADTQFSNPGGMQS